MLWRVLIIGLIWAGILAITLPGATLPGAAWAHGLRRDLVAADGIAISSLTHGQMAVVARHRAAILALAARHYPPDDALRRLGNYAEIQRFWCLWGVMPGTIRDEASPFNLCAHAYLAASRDALLRLQQLRPADRDLQALVYRIEADMIETGASLILCEYSAEGFNTALLIRPDWSGLLRHMPSLAAFGLAGLGVVGLGVAGFAVAHSGVRRRRGNGRPA